MYVGYNLKNITKKESRTNEWLSLFEKHKTQIRKNLKYLTDSDGVIDGVKVQEDWFPEVEADIFISHSHADENLAINLACWLYDTFGLVAFIDSCVWGYANDLLKEIDDKYCRQENKDSYDYNKRNYSTSHVHMMLMTALNKMIDKTECVFFLNTENSVYIKNIENQTLSPWIYGEIEITRTIQKRLPSRNRIELFSGGGEIRKSQDANESLRVQYTLNIGHFNELDDNKLKLWRSSKTTEANALDKLYEITGLKRTIL